MLRNLPIMWYFLSAKFCGKNSKITNLTLNFESIIFTVTVGGTHSDYCLSVSRGGRIRSDPTNLPDPSGSEPDPTRDQMAFNPIEIYQRSEKIQHVN
jgi:hypothetical protein